MMKIIHDPSIDFIVVNPSEKGVPLPEIHLVHGDHVRLGGIPPCDPIFVDDTAELVRKGAPAIGTDIFDGTGDHDSEIHRM